MPGLPPERGCQGGTVTAPDTVAPRAALLPAALPPPDDSRRWGFLQQLRRADGDSLMPWWQALQGGAIEVQADLVAVLLERDPEGAAPLLQWWAATPTADPALLTLLARPRLPALAAGLRQALEQPQPAERQTLLLAALGHQRDPRDWPLLQHLALAPGPRQQRQGALEGILVGLTAWPHAALCRSLEQLAGDLDPALAAAAVDGLARLPRARARLLPLRQRPLDPRVAARLQRRLEALQPAPLLLLVHGRAGATVPALWQELRQELEERRGAPVLLQALTDPRSPAWPQEPPAPSSHWGTPPPLTLVPLFLLPGGHVRRDLPTLAAHWRQRWGALQRLPFLGAWPRWQEALAHELSALNSHGSPPLLLHHPVEGPLAERYLAQLAQVTATPCQAAAYSAPLAGTEALDPSAAPVPLALAPCRLTEALALPALLERPNLRAALLHLLEALP